jgi:hypothetical protein
LLFLRVAELRRAFDRDPLLDIQNRRYGGIEIGKPDGLLGSTSAPKLQAYRAVLADGALREQIGGLLRKSIRDNERFLAHFDALETPPPPCSSSNDDNAPADGDDNIVERAAYAFLLSGALRPGAPGSPPPALPPDSAVLFTTHHPLLVASHHSVLLCLLILGGFTTLLRARSSVRPRLSMVPRDILSFYQV